MSRDKPYTQYYIHLDGDNFFVSCELVRYPHLRNTPVVVGRERGAAVAMNGPAKALGITRGMPVYEIQKNFKGVTMLPAHFESYTTFSRRIGDIIREYSDTLECYSIDEYFFIYQSKGDVVSEMNKLKDDIYNRLGITVSVGIAQTKVLAKTATSINKPNGVTHIYNGNKRELLSKIPTEDIWGIGRRSAPLWKNRGYKYASDFLNMPKIEVERCNKPYRVLIYELQGLKHLDIETNYSPQKSYQSTESFKGTIERSFVYSEVFRHTEILCGKLWSNKARVDYLSVLLRTKHKEYKYLSRQIKPLTGDFRAIFEAIESLFEELYNPNNIYTKTGVTFGSVVPIKDTKTWTLFDEASLEAEVNIPTTFAAIEQVNQVKKALQARFGGHIISIASAQASHQRKRDKRNQLQRVDPYVYGLPLIYLGRCK